MSHYELIDKLIIKALDEVHGLSFIALHSQGRRNECDRLAAIKGRESFRVMDARLQALRKAGKIEYDSKAGWRIKSKLTI